MTATAEPRIRRVLMTGDTVGGVWTFTLELAEALGTRGIEVILAAFGDDPSPDQISEAAAIGNLHLLPRNFKLEWMEDPWRDVDESGRWLMELERQYRPDIVHLNTFGHGALPWRAPTVLTAHSCVLSWWAAVKGGAAPESWNRYRAEVARSLESVDLVTAPSAHMASGLPWCYGTEARKCRVIPNGRDASKFRRAAKEPFVFSAGRIWDEAKNMAGVARAAQGLSWPVYLAGEWYSTGQGKNAVRWDGCRMLGRLSAAAIAGWYARASIYATPARYEPFGLSILEAALSGCALVLGDIPSLREIWNQAAIFVPPEDTGALQEALETLIHSAGLRYSMSHRAWKRALELNTTRMSQQYLDSYLSVVGTSGAVQTRSN